MNTRILSFMILSFALISCSSQNDRENNQENQGEVTNETILQVTRVMEDPSAYTDQKITVEGMVTHVCEHGGKKLHLSREGSDELLRVRTGSGMPPFQRDIEGNTVQVTGTFVEERMDQEYLDQLKKGTREADHHHHEESGEQEKSGNQADTEHSQVSEAYIQQLENKIEASEKGYISEYWLTAESFVSKEEENE